MEIKYRYYQREAISSIAQYLYATPRGSHPLVAMPTGTGKSLVLDGFVFEFLKMYPQLRFTVATHVKELIVQNSNAMRRLWPNAPIGIHSDGLKRRDIAMPIIFGGIKSMLPHTEAFGWRDFIIVDEAHLVAPNDETMYGQFIKRTLAINPDCRVIGLTATAFRTKDGGLAGNGGIFTDICYDITGRDEFNRLIAEGWLSPVIPRPTQTEFDLSHVKLTAGEYNQADLEKTVDRPELTEACLREVCYWGQDRRSWLLFASGINHAEHIADKLNQWGIPTAAVHSKLPAKIQDARIKAYQNGDIRAIVNYGKLTTGFDDPKTDLIGMLRGTKSPGLWVQMLGRGTRPSPLTGKNNCLCLDFAGNARRLGPINDPVIPQGRNKKGGGGSAPIKICANCGNWCHASVRFCEWCSNEFVSNPKLEQRSDTTAFIAGEGLPVVETFDVETVWTNKHVSSSGKTMLQSTYHVKGSLVPFREYILLEHEGYALHRAHDWWRERHSTEPPATVDEALKFISTLTHPKQIRVWLNKLPKPEVTGYIF
jgi:DNA repair protein RadD